MTDCKQVLDGVAGAVVCIQLRWIHQEASRNWDGVILAHGRARDGQRLPIGKGVG